jgi:hypothetical protein
MPIPRVVGRWNKAGLNRLTRQVAPWVPGFGVIVHRGRRTGRRYRTPVNVFPAGDQYVIALTYGPDTDWVKNVLAAGGCTLLTRGRAGRRWMLEDGLTSSSGCGGCPGQVTHMCLMPAYITSTTIGTTR